MTTTAERVPVLRFPEFSGEWEGIKLGEIVVQSYQGVNTAADQVQYVSSGTPIIQAKHITSGELDFSEARSIGSADYKKYCSKFNPVLNDILVSNIGTLGKVIIVHEERQFLIAWNIFLVRLTAEKTSSMFVFHVLKNTASRGYFERMKSGNATKFVNKTDMLAIRIGLPSLPEQKKIAAFLGVVDAKIAALRARKAGLDRYKRGLMQALFSQRLRFTKPDGSAFPDWEEKRLGEVFDWHKTNSLSRENLNYEGGKVQNIHYGDIHTKFQATFRQPQEYVPFVSDGAAPRGFSEDEFCQIGDVVIADASEDYADIGKAIEIVELSETPLVAGLHTYIARPKARVVVGFSGYLLRSAAMRKQIMRIAQGISVLGVSKTNLSKLTFPLPHSDEQQKIADALQALDAKIAAVGEQVDKMEAFKKGLLQQMFV